jgi:hypothetical protein
MANRTQTRFPCFRQDPYLLDKLALILIIAGFVTTLIGGGLQNQLKEHGEVISGGNSSVLKVIIGIIIFLIGALWLSLILVKRNRYGRRSIGYPFLTMADRLRTERDNGIELDVMSGGVPEDLEQSALARPSDVSHRPLLLQRPEPAHLLPARPQNAPRE